MSESGKICITAHEFEQIYSSQYVALNNYIVRSYGSSDDVEDVVQETFSRFWEFREKYDILATKPLTYLCSIAKNVIRENQRASERVEEVNADLKANYREDITDDVSSKEQNIEIMTKAIQLLSPCQKEVIELYLADGFSFEVASQQLGISPRQLTCRIDNAKRQLKKIISKKIFITITACLLIRYAFFGDFPEVF